MKRSLNIDTKGSLMGWKCDIADVTLDDSWRLLSAFKAAKGIIMLGWITAIVIAVVQRVHSGKKVSKII